MHTKHLRTLFRLSIPVCLLVGLVLAAPGVTVRSAPAGAAPAAPTGAADAAPAATPYVVSTTVDEFGTGIACSLREAIQSVNTNANFGGCTGNGDVISLPAGTYTLTGAADEDDNATGDLDVKSNLTIYGAGSKTTVIQPGTDATNGVDRVLHIFDGYAVGISDVTIRYGRTPDGVDGVSDFACRGGDGGGIYSGEDTTLILNDCVVAYNRTGDGGDECTGNLLGGGGRGGGIHTRGDLALNDTIVRQNETGMGGDGALGDLARQGGYGGGIYLYHGEATLTDSMVSTNVTGAGGRGTDRPSGPAGDGSHGGDGGGIYISNTSALTLTNTTVAGNATGAGGDGGDSGTGYGGDGGGSGVGAGIYSSSTTLVVAGSVFYDNATGPSGSGGSGASTDGVDGYRGSGGSLYISSGSDTMMSDTTIRDSDARNGGGLYGWNSIITLDGCTVSANTAADNGGGIYYSSNVSILTLTNSTVSGNGAYESGGGIYNNGIATLTFGTITDNTADLNNDGSGDGGGLYNADTLTMTNTIVAVNYDKGDEDLDCSGTVASGDYNLLGIGDSPGCTFASQPHDQVGTTASPIDPLLGILGDKGGPTWTHSLKLTSPAINYIPEGINGCAAGTYDQRGALRFPACDIGAFEQDQIESVYLPLAVRE